MIISLHRSERKLQPFRRIFPLKEPFNGISHLLAALGALIGTVILVARTPADTGRVVVMIIYGISMVALFGASAAYHSIHSSPKGKLLLRRIDHSAVYLLIAGTFTPPTFILLAGPWRLGLLITVWSIALLGISLKTLLPVGPRWLSAALYLLMGWLGVFPGVQIFEQLPNAVLWLVIGGLFYTVGAVVYVRKLPNPIPHVIGFHGLWHLFVIAGSLCHYLMIYLYVLPYAG